MKKRKASSVASFEIEGFKKYFFWTLVLILIVLSFFILRPYIMALVSAFILAYLVKPIYNRLEKRVGKSSAAFFSVLFVVLIIILPLGLLLLSVIQQAHGYFSGGGLQSAFEKISSSSFFEKYNLDYSEAYSQISSTVTVYLKSAAMTIPTFLLMALITLFAMYYILKEWDGLVKSLKKFIPFGDREKVGAEISQITNVIVYGTLLLALLEGVVAAIGFYLLGMEYFLLLAVLVFFFAFIPAIGPAIVWIPLAIYYFLIQDSFMVLGVLAIGLILSIVIDTIIRAKALGSKTRIHPLIMLIGLLGGIAVFGVFGFIIGPLILAYTIEILEEAVKHRGS